MDKRVALSPGTRLCLGNLATLSDLGGTFAAGAESPEASRCHGGQDAGLIFTIEGEIGRGGSCITYEASRLASTGDLTLYRVKEYYPCGLNVKREPSGRLAVSKGDAGAFGEGMERFLEGFSRGSRLFYSDDNYAMMANQLDVFAANGTSYILSAYSARQSLASRPPSSVRECVSIARQAAHVIEKIHRQGYLYLDLKPENVLVVDGFGKGVQLFDFDSLVSMKDIEECVDGGIPIRISYSKGFAPLEQQAGMIRLLGPHTDVYAVGALLFYLLFGRTPEAPDCEAWAEYDFSKIRQGDRLDGRFFSSLREFFHRSIAVYYGDRYQGMGEAVEKLGEVECYADPALPRIFSTPAGRLARQGCFLGREGEMRELDRILEDSRVFLMFLTGMGGIGKSAFLREYLLCRRERYDAVLYVQFKGSIRDTVCDDDAIEVSTIRRDEAHRAGNIGDDIGGGDYFSKKLGKIREIARDARVLLAIDDFSGEMDRDLDALLSTGIKVILVCRAAPFLPDPMPISQESDAIDAGESPAKRGASALGHAAWRGHAAEFRLAAIADGNALLRLFEGGLGRSLREGEEGAFDEILRRTKGHTLILELVARQVAASRISISRAADIAAERGFSSIAPESVSFEKDGVARRDRIGDILDGLFEAGGLAGEKKALMKAASLIGEAGIGIGRLQAALGLSTKDAIGELSREGWLEISGGRAYMHEVVREAVHRWEWTSPGLDMARRIFAYFRARIVREAGREDAPKCARRLSILLTESEGILLMCRREPEVFWDAACQDLRYAALLHIPLWDEDKILGESYRILDELNELKEKPSKGEISSRLENPSFREGKNAYSLTRICGRAAIIHADNGRHKKARELLQRAKTLARRSRQTQALAAYYDALSAYYDTLLDGAYEAENPREAALAERMEECTHLAIFYSRHGASSDPCHLYVKSLLGEASFLMRSGTGSMDKVTRLIEIAGKVIEKSAGPYADVRLYFHLTRAWHGAFSLDEGAADFHIKAAMEMADSVMDTELEKVEDVISPCANVYYQMGDLDKAMELLFEGAIACARHPGSDAYARAGAELRGHLREVADAGGEVLQGRHLAMMKQIEGEGIAAAFPQNGDGI